MRHDEAKAFFKVPRLWDYKQDPFIESTDIYSNNIKDSFFWEMLLLKRHYMQEIREVFEELDYKLQNAEFINLEEYRNIDIPSLMESKLKRIKSN